MHKQSDAAVVLGARARVCGTSKWRPTWSHVKYQWSASLHVWLAQSPVEHADSLPRHDGSRSLFVSETPEADDNEVDQLFECFKLASDDNHRLLIMGDFNYPDINWNLLRSDNAGQKFLKFVMDCYLEQHVHQPTRVNNILDLVFTSEIQIKEDIQLLAPMDNSDHNVLVWSMQCSNQPIKAKTQLCYNQANYNAMREFVRERISLINSMTESASSMWNTFNGVMQKAIEKFIPRKSTTHKADKPLWLTKKVLRQIRKKT